MGLEAPPHSLVQPPLKMGLELPVVGVIGVNISKDKLTMYCEGSRDLPYNEKGFEELLKQELYAALAGKLAVSSCAVWYYNKSFNYSPHD